MSATPVIDADRPVTVHRIEVRPQAGAPDPIGQAATHEARQVGLEAAPDAIDATRIYLIEGALDTEQVRMLADELFADPVTEVASLGAEPAKADAIIEVHPLPGVMDPDAEPIQLAIAAMCGTDVQVQTGSRFDFHGVTAQQATEIASRCFANNVIQAIYQEPYHPSELPHGSPWTGTMHDVPIRDLDDDALARLSREAHLFLDLEEMRTIQKTYQDMNREPREIELETLAQTWSEHCVHKTLKATIHFDGPLPDRPLPPGHERHADGTHTIDNLLKRTVAAATFELMEDGADWCLSVFVDNAGIVAFDDEHALCFKVETHNHPSALEPYGGAATGIGGCIRDIMGTGLAAQPIASTDVFCVAPPDTEDVPTGCLRPQRILRRIVAGVRDYGNRMGIPTVNGALSFDPNYVGNPLVYCGCVGLMPIDAVHGDPQPGDHIFVLGGRTGRDGIHGATFSSAELTDTHADEFSHAVQIGNPVTEKKALDLILAARDHESGCLYTAITDCGAGGFSSAVGEMGEHIGADVQLERAPLKYDGLSPTEIWISEAQERMVLSVKEENLQVLASLCESYDVEWADLGTFGTPQKDLILNWHGDEIGRLSMDFMHNGLPGTTRIAKWTPPPVAPLKETIQHPACDSAVRTLLSHPNIASKHWVIRQYDHEVQGRTVIKPLVGPVGRGPSDASVMAPVRSSTKGIAIANGLTTGWRNDPYQMALTAIDECVRNLVCVGTDPSRIAILDNFCWPSCSKEENLGSLVLAAEGCYQGAKAYRTPFISGKDSLNNQFTTDDGRTIEIPPTLLISGFGPVPNINNAVTMDFKTSGNLILLVGTTQATLAGSHYESIFGEQGGSLPTVDLTTGPATATAIHQLMVNSLVRSAHDCSDGGLLVAVAEMCIASELGAAIDIDAVPATDNASLQARCFGESPSRYVLEIAPSDLEAVRNILKDIDHNVIGTITDSPMCSVEAAGINMSIEELAHAWRSPLDWDKQA